MPAYITTTTVHLSGPSCWYCVLMTVTAASPVLSTAVRRLNSAANSLHRQTDSLYWPDDGKYHQIYTRIYVYLSERINIT